MFLEPLKQKHLAVKACLYKRCTVSFKVTLILLFMQLINLNWWSVVKCSKVLQCNDGTRNKVSNIIRRHVDNRKLLLICILLLSHSLIFFRFLFYQYMVVFLFNILQFIHFYWKRLCILIVVYVFLLLVYVFLSLSMYSFCCLCILRCGYPDWGFSVLFSQL